MNSASLGQMNHVLSPLWFLDFSWIYKIICCEKDGKTEVKPRQGNDRRQEGEERVGYLWGMGKIPTTFNIHLNENILL